MPKCDVKTRYLPATFAWTALLSTTTLFFCFPCQYYVFRWGTWVPALQGVITFFVLANFTLATFMDPGVIPKGMFIHQIKESSNKLLIVAEKV